MNNQQHQRPKGSSSSWSAMYEKKYILLCLVCGGLAITLGGLFIGIYFILRCFTSSLHYFETIPTYVPAVLLILTGLLVLFFVKRANRYAYLLKLSGAFCLISSVLCVVITITTTVIHMNRLQTLKECVYSQQSRTCTCYAGVDSSVDADEANSKYVFGDTQDCEVIHGILYSCLRALFGLSVLGILVCIFSAMLVYQLLTIPNYADGYNYNECHLSSSGYERPSPLKTTPGYHEYASIPNYSLGPPPPYSNSNSVENLFPRNSTVPLNENFSTVGDKNFSSTTAEIHNPIHNITVPYERSPSTLKNEAFGRTNADHPRSKRLVYPPRSLPVRRRRKNSIANAKYLEQLSAVSLQNLNEMLSSFQRVRELKQSLVAEQNILQALIRSMRDQVRIQKNKGVDTDPNELIISEILDHESEICLDDDSSQSAQDPCHSPNSFRKVLTKRCPVENKPLLNNMNTPSDNIYSEVTSLNCYRYNAQHPMMCQNSDQGKCSDQNSCSSKFNMNLNVMNNSICTIPKHFCEVLQRRRIHSDSCSCQLWLKGSFKTESKKYHKNLSSKKSSVVPYRTISADMLDYPPLSSQSCRDVINPRSRSDLKVNDSRLNLEKIFLSCNDLRKRVACKNHRKSSWSQIIFLQSLVHNLHNNNVNIRNANLSHANDVKSEPHSPAKDKLQKINLEQTRKINSKSINV